MQKKSTQSYLFNHRLIVNDETFLRLILLLFQRIDIPYKGLVLNKKLLALNNLISNILLTNEQTNSIVISRKAKDYSLPSIYGMNHFSYRIIISLLDALIKYNFVEQHKGYYNSATHSGVRTSIKGTEKLFDIFNQNFNFQQLSYRTPIILKDKQKRLIPYQENDEIRRMKNFLNDYNSLMKSSIIELPIDVIKEAGLFLEHGGLIPHYKSYSLESINSLGNLSDNQSNQSLNPLMETNLLRITTLYRVFNNSSLNQGGRFYGASYQSLNSKQRNRILINGNMVVEIDFQGLHINMLYNLEGQEFNGDPYSSIYKEQEIRAILKKAALIALNAKSKISAIKAFEYKGNWNVNELRLIDTYKLKAEDVYSRFETTHSPIAKHLSTGVSVTLQYLDSQIAELVLSHFYKQNIPCLCIHDSFIVEHQYAEELEFVMKESYKKILKFNGKVERKGA